MGSGKGHVPGLALDSDGALWASTEEGGLSRIKDGHVATLTSRNGLPCDTIHGTVQDDRRSLWVYAACGVFRITRPELDAWIAQPAHRVQTTLWDAADGAKLRALAPTSYEPLVSRSTDGKLWFVAGEGVQVLDPQHLASNPLRPPVYVERLTADNTVRWQHLPGGTPVANLRLPPHVRDVEIDYTALSLVAPEKIRFKVQAGGSGSRLAGGRQRSPRPVFESRPRDLSLPRDCLQQQRRLERAGRHAGVLGGSGVLPDELVSSPCASAAGCSCCGRATS